MLFILESPINASLMGKPYVLLPLPHQKNCRVSLHYIHLLKCKKKINQEISSPQTAFLFMQHPSSL